MEKCGQEDGLLLIKQLWLVRPDGEEQVVAQDKKVLPRVTRRAAWQVEAHVMASAHKPFIVPNEVTVWAGGLNLVPRVGTRQIEFRLHEEEV